MKRKTVKNVLFSLVLLVLLVGCDDLAKAIHPEEIPPGQDFPEFQTFSLYATDVTTTSVTLRWLPAIRYTLYYNVHRSISYSEKLTYVGQVRGYNENNNLNGSPMFVDTTVSPGQTYFYQVSADHSSGRQLGESTIVQVATLPSSTGTTPGGTDPGGTTPGGTNPGGTTPGGTNPGGTTPSGIDSVTGLENKLAWLKNNAVSGEPYTIVISEDVNIEPQNLSYSASNITITLRGSGSNRTISLSSNGSMFEIGSGVTLVLENITLQGRSNNNGAVIYVNDGTLIMKSGTTITGNAVTNSMGGGGVYLYSGTFTMSGGTISGNTANVGGGVEITSYGTFIMSGGNITGNAASYRGETGSGGGVASSGSFTMSGGTISRNTARDHGGGVSVYYGSFTKTGGTITGYTSNTDNGNVVRDRSNVVQDDCGHAIYAAGYVSGSTVIKRRETTVGTGDNLSFNGSTITGTWDN